MQKRQRSYVVGVYVAGCAVVLIIVLLWLAGSRFLRPMDRYEVVFNGSVSGLLPGASVELNGVAVGKVTAIHLTDDSPPRVIADLEVTPHTPVRRDSIASLGGNIVTGIRFVQLSGGTAQAGPLPQDAAIKVDESSFEDIRVQATQVTEQTRDLLLTLNHNVFSKNNKAALTELIQNLASTSRNLKTITDDFANKERLASINLSLDNLEQASAKMKAAATSADELASAINAHREQVTQEVDEALARLNRLLASGEHLAMTADDLVQRNSATIHRAVRQIDHATRHLDETIETIQADPSELIFGNRQGERESTR